MAGKARFGSRWLTLGFLFLAGTFGLLGRASDDDTDQRAHSERLEKMTKRWQMFQASVVRDEKEISLKSHPQPLLRWIDAARTDTLISDGTIWAWGTKGRPVALLAQELQGSQWVCELISASTSTQRFAVVTDQGWRWSPEKPGLELVEFPGAGSPAENQAARLFQMKSLIRRLEIAMIVHDEARYELRPLARPIHRYEDPSAGILDGVMFAYARGTNPETIAVVEAHRTESGGRWLYGFLRACTARIEAKLNQEPVWTDSLLAPSSRSRQDPYTGYVTANSSE